MYVSIGYKSEKIVQEMFVVQNTEYNCYFLATSRSVVCCCPASYKFPAPATAHRGGGRASDSKRQKWLKVAGNGVSVFTAIAA